MGLLVHAASRLEAAALAPDQVGLIVIGTTHFTNAVIERRHLAKTAVVRLSLPANRCLPPMVDWPQDLRSTVGEHIYETTGWFNFDGTPIAPLGDEQRKVLQAMVDEFHERFKQVVTQGRPEVDPDLKTNFDGRVFTAEQARERRLIDHVGYLDDAIGTARELAGAPCPDIVFYHRSNDPARSPYAITPNVPLQNGLFPISLPGFDRTRLPAFLYLWQPEPTMEKAVGR